MSSPKTNWPKACMERSRFLFNNELLSDVKFIVQASQNGESDSKRSKMEIPAHKFLLSICSPVFFAMFCGEMAETKEHIDLPDCEYEGMLELLRYIYTDEVCLNGDNVMQVLYLAEKYMIPNLTSKCTKYLECCLGLDPSNAFGVLKQARLYDNKDLLFECWYVIDNTTEEVLESDGFFEIERPLLEELVQRDTLNVAEVELFKAVDRWAKEECKRSSVTPDGPTKRQILGENVINSIRFPIMERGEFKQFVLKSNILTQEETRKMKKYSSCKLTSPVGFLESERSGCFMRCCRFWTFLDRVGVYWPHRPDSPDILKLTVDKDIILRGVSIFGQADCKYSVTLNILEDEDRSLLATTSGQFTAVKKRVNDWDIYHGFDVLLDSRSVVTLKKDVKYCFEASIEGPCSYFGNDVGTDCDEVSFSFEDKWETDDYGELFNPSQIPEILFQIKE